MLYNVDLEDFVGDYYNTSEKSGRMRLGGVPFGFQHRHVPGYEKGFPVYLDIAATRSQTANMIQYLKEGLFIDPLTRSISAQAVTYNANLKQMANVMLNFEFNDAGYITLEHKITNMNVKWYTEWSDDNNDGINDGYAQLALEFVLCVMIAYAVYCEVMETVGEIYEEKSLYRGLSLHFMSFWNYLDAINLTLQVAAMLVWFQYQLMRRADLFPLLRYDVYDNPAAPMANYFMPFKSDEAKSAADAAATVTPLGGDDNRTAGIASSSTTAAPPADHRWQLPTDESGMIRLGESMNTIKALSELLTMYFSLTGISLLLMIARSLKMLDFQRHLDLTVRTLGRSGLDLMHFMVIFFYTMLCSSMFGIVMVGAMEESLSTFDKAFNFHFELLLGSSVEILAAMFADSTVVRSPEEYFALIIYSFGVPVFILFILLNLILGIVGDAFGEEKENLAELDEPTLLADLLSNMSYRYGRITGKHPSYTKLIQTLRVLRKPKSSKAADVLAKGMGGGVVVGGGGGGGGGGGLMARLKEAGLTKDNQEAAPKGAAAWRGSTPPDGKKPAFKRMDTFFKKEGASTKNIGGLGGAADAFAPVVPAAGASSDLSRYDVPVKKSALGSLFGVAGKKQGLAALAKNASHARAKIDIPDNLKPKEIPVLGGGNVTKEASVRAKAGWNVVKKKGVQANRVFAAMGINVSELRRKNPVEQAALANRKGGAGLLLDVLVNAKDEDSDSDSSIDEEVKERRKVQNKLRGKPTAWSAIKQHVKPPQVNVNPEWQNLMDDTWREFMDEVKEKQADEADAKMFRLNKVLYTEEEVTEWLLDAELDAQREGYFGEDRPDEEEIDKVIGNICDHKIQQFKGDSDDEEEQEELDEIIETCRDIKGGVTKVQRFCNRELGWQNQTLRWQKRVSDATEKVEEELVVTHQVMSDISKKIGTGGGGLSAMKGVMRERLWATLQAKRALREALLHAPGLGRGGAALDILSGKKVSKWDDSGAPAALKGGTSMKTNPLLAKLAGGGGGGGGDGAAGGSGGLMSRWQLAKLGAQVEVAKKKPPSLAAMILQLKLEAELKKRKEKPKDLSKVRTNPVSLMRRHRVGKKEAEAKKQRLKGY